MIIQLSSTLDIISIICRHVQKQFAYTPSFVITESHMFVITHAESGWSRTWLPTQPLGVGREVVELDGPWELHECIGPGDEFLWREYDHDVSFLMDSATRYSSLSLRMTLPSKPNTAHPHPIIKPEFSRESTTAPPA